ncbi:tyrosine-type recombinase/integrase [Aliivibrio sp. S4TY2]|uniref:tyrosine-type recombinase/integrase n=1 Tax=unclassified Aliivibrio TaxID=2645654 RepID=UPI002379A56E|nr:MULTISPECIES: tyrosine-type recombinase/integrase [unclassified Aliivibrio]MDD9157833.1 tyrosine-type recombinase/integrase [Aliivibrio sp. S4TY2]MDD9161815.1 tyrosine-type recombinase/integrase [Aliivibrio sp. S4TY1]MDD9165845.1 tyrosine-type recombinase/integrase [Aliivibrio sp. S4MY2]MDD9169832.1 tyrosine-type recombinase/integrase [Aliivibrio sp. S4MY4]MDD9186825.1 tyrosine-type recombinase/integrase [Aliivibrio sp. S4MY3]
MDKSIFLTSDIDIDTFASCLKKKYSRNSLISFKNDWNNFVVFCQLHHVMALPASTTAIRIFIEKQAKEKKLASIKRSLISISHVHNAFELKDPTQTAQVKAAVGKIRLDKRDDSKQTEGITLSMLAELERQLSSSVELKDIRDLVIWHLMFELLLKRGELRDLTLDDVCFDEFGNCVIQLKQNYYPLSQETTLLLNNWLSASHLTEGYLFRGLDRHQNLSSSHLNDSSIYRIFRRANELLNLEVNFSGLSARVGATKELSKCGYTVHEIQELGRWVSPAMPNQYIGNIERSERQKDKFKKKPE